MDDEAVFGPVLHRLSFGEAIERDLLSDYQVVVVGRGRRDLPRLCGARRVRHAGRQEDHRRADAGGADRASPRRSASTTCSRSSPSTVGSRRRRSSAPSCPRWSPGCPRRQDPMGSFGASMSQGKMTSGHRDRLLLRFRDLAPKERGLLSNARCLGEGVDVPASTAWRSSTPAAPPSTSSRPSAGRSASPPTRSSGPSCCRCSSRTTRTLTDLWTSRRSSTCGMC